MDNQTLIEQDLDFMDRIWMEDCSWLSDFSIDSKQYEMDQDAFIGCDHKKPILISILMLIFGSIIFFIVGLIML
jgi:hypothetical protein